jgi:hypothetical protein
MLERVGSGATPRLSSLSSSVRGPPVAMQPAQLADRGFGLGSDLVSAGLGAMAPIGEAVEATFFVAADPTVHDLAGDSVAFGDLGHREPVGKNLHDCLVALLHDAQLHEHVPTSLGYLS